MVGRVISMLLLAASATSVRSQEVNPGHLCDGKEVNSFVPDPENCNKFFQCNGDSFIHGNCPGGMFYDPQDVCSSDASSCASTTDQPPATTAISPSEATTEVVGSTTLSQESTTTATDDPEQLCLDADPSLPHFIKSPTECSEYYICINRKAVLQKCHDGKYWNPAQLYCDDPKNVPCKSDGIPNPDKFCSEAQSTDASFTASPTDCGEYYVCVQQKPFLMHCAPGSHWNDNAKQCDEPQVAGCKVMSTILDDLDSLCTSGGETFIGHPKYCNLYIYCRNGKASTQLCPFLTDWDTTAERCFERHRTKCTKQRLH